jgi:hypothetical protein
MHGNSDFPLPKTDLALFRQLEGAFRNLLKMPAICPEEIVGLARAIRCIQRLPRSTPDTDVSILIEYSTHTFEASSTIRLSSEELSADYSAASRMRQEYEFESFPSLNLSIELDGGYDLEGDKYSFFRNFIGSAESINPDAHTVTVVDDSVPTVLHPFEGEDI